MSTHRIIKSIILVAIIIIGSFTSVVAQGFSNPISPCGPDDFPDPSVVYHNGYYYGVDSENGSSQIAVYKSRTLKDLYFSGTKTIVWVAPPNTDHSEAIWAPFLQYIQGNWYIYYTATWNGVLTNHRMFALTGNTQDPQGSYRDSGSIYATNTDFYAIDGKVIIKPTDGSLYFVWSGAASLPQQNIYIAPMSDPTHISGLAVKINGTNASWENTVHESTDFIYKNGKSILSYSTGQLLNPGPAGYKTGTLTNTDGNYLTASSWVKSSGSVFQYYSGTDGEVYAPGACRFIKSPDGTEDWLVYHAKNLNDFEYNREIRAQKFTWDANDNPLFEHPIPSGVIMPVPSGEESLPAEITSEGNYKIIARNSSLALTVKLNSSLPGAQIEQRSFTGTDNQKWVITNLENGYYKIISKNSLLALAITNSSINSGATLEQQTYTGQNNQQWKLSNLGNGYYVITSKFSQKCMDVTGNVVTEGTLINQWPYLGFNNQQWTLVNLLETPVVTPIIGTYTYSGAPQGPNAATNTGTGTAYTYSYVGTGGTIYGPSATPPTNIGRYTVIVTVAANGNYISASSSARTFSIEAASPNRVVYSENFENATVGLTTLGNADAMNYGGGATWTFGLNTNNPITGLKSGYFDVSNTGTDWWTLQYRIESKFAVRQGAQYKVTFNAQSSIASTILFYAQVNSNFSQTLNLTGGNVIEKISFTTTPMDSSGNNPNFLLAFGNPGVPAQISIDDIVIEEVLTSPIVTPTIGTYTYSGAPQGPNAATNTGTGTSYTYSYVNSGGVTYGPAATAPTNAGNYTVTVTVAANGNYGSSSSTATGFTIGTATPTVTVTPIGTYTYSGAPQGPTIVTGNTGSGMVSWSYVGTGSTTYTASATRPTNAGTYTATATVTANGNYGSATSSATAFTIGVATPTVTPTIGTYTYTGSAQGPNTATNTGTGTTYTYSYVNSGGTTYGPSTTPPTNEGSYTVIVNVAANGNYGSASSSVTAFIIGKALPSSATVCAGTTVASFVGTSGLKFYTAPTRGTAIGETTTFTVTRTYFVTQVLGDAESSPRQSIVVTVNALPTTPTALVLTNGATVIKKVGNFIGTSTELTLTATAAGTVPTASYNWTLPTDVAQVSGDSTNVVTINFQDVAAANTILDFLVSAVSDQGCVSKRAKKLTVTRTVPGTPKGLIITDAELPSVTKITKLDAYTGALKTRVLTLTATPNVTAGSEASSYKWVLPAGVTTTATPVVGEANTYTSASNVISIDLANYTNETFFLFKVYGVNGNGESLLSKNLTCTSAVPKTPGAITKPSPTLGTPTFNADCKAIITIEVPSVLGATYTWSVTGGASITDGQGSNSITINTASVPLLSMYFGVSVTASNGNGTSSPKSLTIRRNASCAKIAPENVVVEDELSVIAYPNPSSSEFTIESSRKGATVKVYDMTGRLIESRQATSNVVQVGRNYQSGIYNVIVNNGSQVKTLKVIKK